MMNITNLKDMTPEQILVEAHNATARPSLILGFISSMILILLILMISANNNKGRKKLFLVWCICVLIVGLVYFFLIQTPFFVQDVSKFFNFT